MSQGKPFSIDGLRIHVADCSPAGSLFEELGFAVTPRSQLPGLSNRLVCFTPKDPHGAAFIELLSIDDRSAASAAAVNLLDRGYGPIAAILSSADAQLLAREIGDSRIEPRNIKRRWTLADRALDVSLTTLNVPSAVSPLGWTIIQHRTPEHYRIQEFVEHTNGVTHFGGVIAVAEQPDTIARHFLTLWGGDVSETTGTVYLRIGPGEMRIHTPEALQKLYGVVLKSSAPQLIGAVLETPDIDQVALRTRAPGLIIDRAMSQAYLPPENVFGCLLVFVAPGRASIP